MKNRIFITVFLFFPIVCLSQKKVSWEDLANVTYTEKFFPSYDEYFLYPEFGSAIKALEGEEVSITGYFLNIDSEGNIFILSKGPMAACFFCGVGGPQTAVELQFQAKPNFRTDAIVSITGRLKLNTDDVEHFNYILTNCKGEIVN